VIAPLLVILPAPLGAALNPVTIGGHGLETQLSRSAGRGRHRRRVRGARACTNADRFAVAHCDRRTTYCQSSQPITDADPYANGCPDRLTHAATHADGNRRTHPICAAGRD
jgi:hypothetical protein